VHQAPLPALAGLLQQKGDLLKPRMKITAYNHHARLLSSRASWSFSRNQFTQVEGADAVMQSFIHSFIVDEWDTTNLDRQFFSDPCSLIPDPYFSAIA
jgi:hypothetical protein